MEIDDLENDERIAHMERKSPGVISVLRLLVQRALTEEFEAPARPGYSMKWLQEHRFGDAVQRLLINGWVSTENGRVLLKDAPDGNPSPNTQEKVAGLAMKNPGVRIVYDALLLGITLNGQGESCLLPQWLAARGFMADAEILLEAGIIRREEDPLLGEVWMLV